MSEREEKEQWLAWHNSLTDIRAKVFRKTAENTQGVPEVIDSLKFSSNKESWILNRFAGANDMVLRL